MYENAIMKVSELQVEYAVSKKRKVHAVNGVTIGAHQKEVLGIVGESGCGKSTIAYAMLNMVPPPGRVIHGEILYFGMDEKPLNVISLKGEDLRRYRWKEVSMIFQASQSVLNPIMNIGEHFIDTCFAHGLTDRDEILKRARNLLNFVKLDQDVLKRYPHELSGGMKQRTIISLSLVLNHKVLILDEPTSALDLLTQKYVLDVLKNINQNLGITMIFITHDITILAGIATRLAVMYAGKVVEIGPVVEIFNDPKHPYTTGLICAIPSVTKDLTTIKSIPGVVPDLLNPPYGCVFYNRCSYASEACRSVEPQLVRLGEERYVACHRCE